MEELETGCPLARGAASGWLRGLQRKAEAREPGEGQVRLHQWLPERLPPEKSLWRPLPLVPSTLGKEGRGEEWEDGSLGSRHLGQEGEVFYRAATMVSARSRPA